MADKIVRVDVLVLGERNFPVSAVKLPETAVADLPELLEAAKRMNPSLTYDEVVRSIWRYGTKVLRDALARGVPLKVSDLPGRVKPIPVKSVAQ